MKNFNSIYRVLFIVLVWLFTGIPNIQAQDASDADTTQEEERIDDSSAFQDSIKYDDMDPIFYEAEEEEEAVTTESSSGGNTMTYALVGGILVVLIVIIWVVRRSSAKKSSGQ